MSNDIQFGIRVGYDGKLVTSGAAATAEQIKKIGEWAKRAGADATTALDLTGLSAKQTAAALRGVPAQFTDIFTQLAAGQNPLQVFIQQGGQLKDMFGGAAPAARALGGYIAGLVNPYTVAAAAVGGLAFAYHQGAKETDAYTRALILSGNAAGTTASQMAEAARRVAAATGGTQGAAAEALTLAIGAGVPGEALGAVADAAVRMEQVAGKAIDDTVAEFAKLARDPVAASVKLNEQTNYLTEATYRQIKAFEDQGRHTDAVALAMKTYADVVAERAREITKNLSPLEDKWLGIKAAAKGAIDAIWDVGRPADAVTAAVEKVLDIKAKIRDVEKNSDYTPQAAAAELVVLNDQLVAARANMVAVRDKANADTAAAEAKKKANAQQQAGISLAQEEAKYLSQKVQMERELTRLVGIYEASAKTAADQEALRTAAAGVRTKFAEKAKPVAVDNGLDDAEREANKEYARSIEQLVDIGVKATGAIQNLTAAELVREKLIQSGAWDKLAPATRAVVDAYVAAGNATIAAAAAEKEWSAAAQRAQQDMEKRLDSLDAQAIKAELEVANYGLSAGAIERNTIAHLEERRAIEAGLDGHEAMVAALDREIAARQRLAAASDSKDALDANKKATEEMRRDWERMHEQLSQSLTDELMKGGRNAGDLLESYFKTLVLRPIIQGVVNVGLNAAGQALSINSGSGGGVGSGGVSNLLSLGSNLSNLGGISAGYASFATSGVGSALGLGSATAAGYAAPVYASALEGGALLSAGSGTAAGGLSAAGAGIGAALPWIGGALAIASIFGGMFGSKKPAPIEWALLNRPSGYDLKGDYWDQFTAEGPFGEVTAIGQHLKRNNQSAAGLKAAVADPIVALDQVLAQYLDKDEISTIGQAINYKAEVEHGFTQGEVKAVMMARLNRISDAIGGWADDLFDTTSGNIQKRYTELAQILSIRGDETAEKLAQDMFNAVGKWQYEQFAALQAGVQRFNDAFLSDGERFDATSDAMHKALEKLNLAFPESRDGFKDLVLGIDTSTKAGFEMYSALIDLAPAMDGYYDALKSELDIKTQLADMENNFATAVDYTRYQRVAQNYDPTFAADYAYNISLGTIKPGAAANDDLAAEVRALRADMRARDIAIALPTQYTADTLRRWNTGGMPATRT